ncbi:hypothetical protein FAZ15_03110 [Sphingobacterium olei]|uniref:Uncharacterized protein n=1 Tax=Sphingobacterium olei TaxID=2571155 RepID=A0A4U0P732_9SPHI|nr:hypothetical protein [Sphingobacterium olei]TJZ63287.1 hypothetical protein FAZ15_03110 [Sphingobacterium olei]
MHHKRFILVLLLLLSKWCHAQTDCDELFAKTFDTDSLNPEKLDSLINDFGQLRHCGLDSLAFEISTGYSMFGLFIIPPIDKPYHKVTYREVFNMIQDYRNSPDYPHIVDIHKATQELKKRQVNLENWAQDRKILEKIPLKSSELDAYHQFLTANDFQDLTYYEAWIAFKSEQKIEESEPIVVQKKPFFVDESVGTSLHNVFERAKEEKKEIVFYFTGWANISSRKLEYKLFKEDWVGSQINERFLFVPLYIDDAELLSELDLNEELDIRFSENAKFNGQKNHNFQKHYLHEKAEIPSFAIIDYEGKLIRYIEKDINKKSFFDFLGISQVPSSSKSD